MAEDSMVQALLHERAGYMRCGMTERAAAVDEQLRLRGVTPPVDDPDTEPIAANVSRETPPRKRRTVPKDTT